MGLLQYHYSRQHSLEGIDIRRTEKNLDEILEGPDCLEKAALQVEYENKDSWIHEKNGPRYIIRGAVADGAYTALLAGLVVLEAAEVFPEGYKEFITFNPFELS